MAEEQRARYEEYAAGRPAARAGAAPAALTGGVRPAAAAARLHAHDLRHAGDPRSRPAASAPKLEELERVLDDLLAEPDRKVIVFSEWERMLELVRELAARDGRRGAPGTPAPCRNSAAAPRSCGSSRIRPAGCSCPPTAAASGSICRSASAVINVDLPWNPAKLEQRIARAWRKHQTRAVTVVNLVAEDTIEHGMLHLLGAQAGAGRRRARRPGRSFSAQDAVRPRRHDRAHAGDDGRPWRCQTGHGADCGPDRGVDRCRSLPKTR